MAPCPQATSAATPTSLIPFALRTSGCNATREQGSDSAPVQTIAFTIIDHRYTNTCNKATTIEELDVSSLGLQAALQKVNILLTLIHFDHFLCKSKYHWQTISNIKLFM